MTDLELLRAAAEREGLGFRLVKDDVLGIEVEMHLRGWALNFTLSFLEMLSPTKEAYVATCMETARRALERASDPRAWIHAIPEGPPGERRKRFTDAWGHQYRVLYKRKLRAKLSRNTEYIKGAEAAIELHWKLGRRA